MPACLSVVYGLVLWGPSDAPAAGRLPLYLRGTQFVVYSVRAADRVEFDFQPMVMKGVPSGLPGYEVIDHASDVIARVACIEQPVTVSYLADEAGLNALVLRPQRHWCRIDGRGRPFVVRAAQSRPIHFKGVCPPLYFLVPRGVSAFAVIVMCPDKREGGTLQVFAPSGEKLCEETDWFHKPRRVKVSAPAEYQGRSWWLRTADPKLLGKPYGVDDVVLCFDAGIPPFVSLDPTWLVSVLTAAGEVAPDQLSPAAPAP